DDQIVRAADHQQMLDIIAPYDDELALSVQDEDIDHPKPGRPAARRPGRAQPVGEDEPIKPVDHKEKNADTDSAEHELQRAAPEDQVTGRGRWAARERSARMTSVFTTPAARGFERVARPGLMALMLLAVVISAAALVFAPGEFGRRAVSFTIAALAIFGVFSV